MTEKMKAAVLHGIGDIRFETVDVPTISEDDVLIRVKYVGICGSDLPRSMISGLTGNTAYPLILGHEFSGEVARVGANVEKVKAGDRVTVAPLVPCGTCEFCREGDYGLCDHYAIIGTRVDGAMAEYVKVPQGHVLKLPDTLDYKTAAGVEPSTIAYHGAAKAEILPGDTVAVLGCGPIGQFAVQWAKVFGASRIIAVDIFEDKLALARELGATDTINSKDCDPVERLHELVELGADAVLETAGSKFTQEQSLSMVKKHGHIVFIGISHGELPLSAKSTENILRSEITLRGSWNSYTAPYPGRAWDATLDFMGKGDVVFKPMISHVIQLEEAGEYLSRMANRKIPFNKVLIEI